MKTRKIVMSLLALLATVCMAFSVVMLSNTNTKAYAVSEATAEQFVVLNSASVRTVDEETAGVRYITKISVDFYNSVKDQNPEWHTLYAIEQEDETAITLDLAGVMDIDNGGAITPYGHDEDGDGNYDYYKYQTVMSLYKENATEEEKLMVYNLNLSARSYVKVGDNVIYSYADSESDTHRNAAEVAEKVLVEDQLDSKIYDQEEMAGAKAILSQYISAKSPILALDTLAYLEDFSASTDDVLSSLAVPDGTYVAYINDNEISLTVKGGEAHVADGLSGLTQADLGDVFAIKLISLDGANYAQAVKYVSGTIDDAGEFEQVISYYKTSWDDGGWYNYNDPKLGGTKEQENPVSKYYDGAVYSTRYFVLTKNIDFSSNTTIIGKDPGTIGIIFDDHLDGQGYTITAKPQDRGVFSSIAQHAVIENVKFDLTGSEDEEKQNVGLAYYIAPLATIQNTYIDYKLASGAYNAYVAPLWCKAQWSLYVGADRGFNLNNVYIHLDSSVVPGEGATYGYLTGKDYLGDSGFNFSNVNVVSSTISKATGNGFVGENQEGANRKLGVFYYPNASTLANTNVGDWKVNADGSAVWTGATDVSCAKEYAQNNLATEVYVETIATPILTLGYLEDFSASTADSLTALGVADGVYTITINSISQEITVAGGVASVNQSAFGLDFSANLGDTYLATIVDASSNKYYQNVRYVSSVINDTTEFLSYLKYYTMLGDHANCNFVESPELYYDGANFVRRLYVLGNDISWTAWSDVDNAVAGNTTGIVVDDFDGQGYTISGTSQCPGFFHAIANDTTIKNLGLNITDIVDWESGFGALRYLIAKYVGCGVTFENMYINFIPQANSNVAFVESANWSKNPHGHNIIDTYLYVPEYNIVEGASNQWGYVAGYDWPESTFSNYHVVSPTLNKAINGAGTATVKGATHYDTVEELLAVKAKVGNWVINADGTATWDGTTNVDEEAINSASGSTTIDNYDTTQEFVAEALQATIATDGSTTITVADVKGLVYNGYVAMATLNTDLVSIENGVITALGSAGTATITVAWQVCGVAYTATVEIAIG